MYSIKFQIVYDFFNKKIVDIFADNGKVHDFQILKNSNLEFSEKTIIIGDLGYQGIQNIYKNTIRLYLKLELKLNMSLLNWKDSKF
ncbi:transposase [Spiroplasma endosymbiont of Villa modesta]|uniref:transposase n=1 Tax=Spiroplasma endosymbiont of Villa modesta TaxID=3066293 RepID=UPI00313BA891